MNITRILVPADWVHEGHLRRDRAEFTLGPGPCGKTVTRLDFTIDNACAWVLQVHEDGTFKRFVYPLAQLTGRVEVEYA